jgi:uncharacterized protein YoxC
MELDGISVLILGVSFGVVVLLLINTHRFQRQLGSDARQLEGMLSSLEQQAVNIKADVQRLQRKLDAKTDHQYLDKRIDGLVQLIKNH